MREPPDLRRVGTSRTKLGECVRYDLHSETTLWLDIPESRALRLDVNGDLSESTLGPEAAFACWTEDDGSVSGCDGGLFLNGVSMGVEFLSDDEVLNDGAVHPSGEFLIFGSRDRKEDKPLGHMWCLGRDLICLPWRFTVFNGPAFSPDGRTIYFADSPQRTIYSAIIDPIHQTLSDRKVFAVVPDFLGYPDGMVCDHQGAIWSAHWDGGCITRYLPDGSVDHRIKMPVARVTSLAFKGSTLFATSAMADDPISTDQAAGGLFSFNAGVAGPASSRLKASALRQIPPKEP